MTTSFDRLARIYWVLEKLAFGSILHQARLSHLSFLTRCRRILILGEGDGRFLAHLVKAAPTAMVECVEASRAMVARATARLSKEDALRVTFRCEDARCISWKERSFDAVVTLFFLDCFTEAEIAALVPSLASALEPGGPWLWADFSQDVTGWRRFWANAWLTLLYGFFRRWTGISAQKLPAAEYRIRAQGLTMISERRFDGGFIRSVVFQKPSCGIFPKP